MDRGDKKTKLSICVSSANLRGYDPPHAPRAAHTRGVPVRPGRRCRTADDGPERLVRPIESSLFWTQEGGPGGHFTLLLDGIEQMMLTGKPSWNVERTLLTEPRSCRDAEHALREVVRAD